MNPRETTTVRLHTAVEVLAGVPSLWSPRGAVVDSLVNRATGSVIEVRPNVTQWKKGWIESHLLLESILSPFRRVDSSDLVALVRHNLVECGGVIRGTERLVAYRVESGVVCTPERGGCRIENRLNGRSFWVSDDAELWSPGRIIPVDAFAETVGSKLCAAGVLRGLGGTAQEAIS
jgi:hypothetical protein